MSTVLRIGKRGKGESASSIEPVSREDLDTRIELIQALIPLGLQAVEDVLQQEVRALAGPRYARDGAPHLVRWGRQRARCMWPIRSCPFWCPECATGRRALRYPCRVISGSRSRGRRMKASCGGSSMG